MPLSIPPSFPHLPSFSDPLLLHFLFRKEQTPQERPVKRNKTTQ